MIQFKILGLPPGSTAARWPSPSIKCGSTAARRRTPTREKSQDFFTNVIHVIGPVVISMEQKIQLIL
jgi:hypothetical protein